MNTDSKYKKEIGIKNKTDVALIRPVLADYPASVVLLTVRLGQKNAYGLKSSFVL